MLIRRFHTAILSALLAFAALFAMTAAAGWHSSSVHADGASAQVAAQAQELAVPTDADLDLDKEVHLFAHALGEGVDAPELAFAGPRLVGASIDYAPVAERMLLRQNPDEFLRPPRG